MKILLGIIIGFCIGMCCTVALNGRYEKDNLFNDFKWMNTGIYEIIKNESIRNDLNVKFVCSVIQYESGDYCDDNLIKMITVKSYAGAVGIMQVMPFHTKTPGLLYRPEYNIKKGCWYLGLCMKKAKRLKFTNVYAEAARMYNGGLHNVRSKYRNWKYVFKIIKKLEG